ncbi:MAG: D-cysteine desulfhydrase family protein [Candidatus Aminicenantia bacterium]
MRKIELVEDLRKRKETLFSHPTPLEKMRNLSSLLGIEIFIKREDLIGVGFGGNKIRKIEYLIADVKHKVADAILTWGGVQSNWCRAISSVCKIYGIEPDLVLFRRKNLPDEYDGNLYLEHIIEANIEIVDGEGKKLIKMNDIAEIIEEKVKNLEKMGKKTYIAPIGASLPEGSMEVSWGGISYIDCFYELMSQCKELGFKPDWVVHATGSGGTQAGLIAGSKLADSDVKIIGISVSDKSEEFKEIVKTILYNIQNYIQVDLSLREEDIIIIDDYLGEGYGIVNKDIADCIRKVAELEGIFLDPVYTGKAMTGLVDLIKKGVIKRGENIIFIHTGGLPALFPYRREIGNLLGLK